MVGCFGLSIVSKVAEYGVNVNVITTNLNGKEKLNVKTNTFTYKHVLMLNITIIFLTILFLQKIFGLAKDIKMLTLFIFNLYIH